LAKADWRTILAHVTLTTAQQARLAGERPVTAALCFAVFRLLSALMFRPRVRGLEHLPASGPFILAPNHQSFLDAAVLAGVLPFRVFRRLFVVGATEYFETPISAWLASRMNIVPVDPDANLVRALQAGAFGLRAGKVLLLFPEGERSIDGTVKKFKRGAGILSLHLDVPIVPVAVDGMFEVWPRARPFRWTQLLPWSRHRVRIAFGPPLPPGEHAKLREEVDRMWNDLHNG
jgi:long-chain acyl-CoA synthetase